MAKAQQQARRRLQNRPPSLPSSSQQQHNDFHSSHTSSALLQEGRVTHLNLASGYGFLTPITPDKDQPPNTKQCTNVDGQHIKSSHLADQDQVPSSVYFKLPPADPDAYSSCHSGLMKLHIGDKLEYIKDCSSGKPRALHTRLVTCCARSTDDMASYVKRLISYCLDDGLTDVVLRNVTIAPIGLLHILQHTCPDQKLTILILKLAIVISDQFNMSSLILSSKAKEFFQLLIHTPFFTDGNGALCKLFAQLRTLSPVSSAKMISDWGEPLPTLVMSTRRMIRQVLVKIPEELPFLVCMIETFDRLQIDWQHGQNSTANYKCSFAVEIIKGIAQARGIGLGSDGNLPYTEVSLLPSVSELKGILDKRSKGPALGLPVAKWKGAYDSTDNYIDTYFRLLREDSFASLKQGISDFLNEKLDNRDMTVWFGVSVMGMHFQQSLPGAVVGLCLSNGESNRKNPKLPLAGGLLCICDRGGSFKDPIWAIAVRTTELSRKKTVLFIEVLEDTPLTAMESFKSSSSPWGRIVQATNMVVAESPAYYRAYEPVLKALQRLNAENMPFQSELVSAISPVKPPTYLNEFTTMDWTCLNDSQALWASYGELKAGVHELTQPTLSGFKTCLDSSQVAAVNHVLQNRLAMIQGPPGTGKTFLSVKIVELLMSASTRPRKPMLIVTYKNRALDQFLESCLHFCEAKDIIRVGGRSTSDKLANCNLHYLLRTAERKPSSDWAQNCSKLESIQTELRKSLCKLHKCQAFNMETITSQVSLQSFVKKLLFTRITENPLDDALDTRCKAPLQSFMKRPLFTRTAEKPADYATDLSASIQKEHHDLLKEWMPPTHVLNVVHGSFSSKMPATSKRLYLKVASNDKDQEESDDSEDDDEERNESEMVLQDFKGGNPKSKKEMDWLLHNYLNLADLSLPNALFRNNCFGNFELNEYSWLLEAEPWKLSPELRAILILVIMRHNSEACLKEFLGLKEEYDKVCADNAEINKQKRIAILKEAKIIGMTTTGAAINQDIIDAVAPSIILVEEAGEILEPHLMALLSPSVEHLILIGDHKQLRPSVENYQLEVRHNLGLSMLERLAENNKLPYVALGLQSRMREEFLPMIKPIYPALKSNTSVVNGYKNQPASCMATTRYFWNHSVEETTGRSPTNNREAQMVVALLKWLLAEGLKHEEITIICAYNGQVSQIRKELQQMKREEEKSVDVQTIDRYQGSENRIVIASLVRSNKEGKIGHLMAQNRLCVTVSRARSGLYMCGNAETLSQRSAHWKTLLDGLKRDNCLGDKIHLTCPRHPNSPSIPLHNHDAQNFSPKLCAEPCKVLMACGHLCTSTCHSGEHNLCKVQVQYRFPACHHSTMKPCSVPDTSMKCMEKVQITLENCNHIKHCMCWKRTENKSSAWMCEVPCGKTLPCTHPCTLLCGQDCCSKTCPTCDKINEIKAWKEKEMQINQIKEKMAGIHREIEKLKSDPLTGPVVKELSKEGETAPEYHMVQDRTEKFIQKTHKHLPLVTRIQKITNTKLELKFWEAKNELFDVLAPTQLLFHGTDDGGVEGITNTGFRLPSANKNNMFGVGCYFATDSSKSAQMLYTKGSNKLLLCEVLIGHAWSVDSAKPDLDYKIIRAKNYDSVFSKRNCRASGGTEFDEYIVYNPSQAIPRYVVHYQNMDWNTYENSPLRDKTGSSFGRRVLQASSSSFAGVTQDEYHFRFAEAQFYRMSEGKKLKVEKVEYTWNRELEERYFKTGQRFNTEKKPVEEKLVFHGTTKESIDKIVREGFKVGGQGGVPIRCGALYGHGVYTAANPEISIPYSRESGMILLSKALCGELNDDYKIGASSDIFVVMRGEQLLPMYIVHFCNADK